MIKVLLLSAGTNACYHFAKILKTKFKNFYLVGTDINDKALLPSIHYLDSYYQVPLSKSKTYYKTIIDICKKEQIECIFPSLDVDLKLFHKENADLRKMNIKSFGISSKTANFYENKKFVYDFLNKNNIPIPQVYSVKKILHNVQYFIKPVDGYGSINATAKIGKDILLAMKQKKLDIEKYIIQELCHGPEVTLECFVLGNNFRSIARERIATKAGVCVKTKILNLPELNTIAKRITKIIKCPNCFNIQFMLNSKNKFVVTDINLRFAGGMSLSYAAGWDEASALASIMLNKSNNEIMKYLPEHISPQFIVRAYEDIVTFIEKPIAAIDLDGTLLDSRNRHIAVLNDAIDKYGYTFDTHDLIDFKRNGKNTMDYLLQKKVPSIIAKKIFAYWAKHIEDREYLMIDSLYPTSLDFINSCYRKYNLILVTARNNKKNLMWQVKQNKLDKYFNKIIVVPSNSNTSVLKSKILIKEKATIFFGDTLSDALASYLADVEFVHFNNGFHSKKFIEMNISLKK